MKNTNLKLSAISISLSFSFTTSSILGLICFLLEPINQRDYLLFSIILFDCNFVIIHGANDVSQDIKITLPLIIHINAKLEILIVTIDDNCTLI